MALAKHAAARLTASELFAEGTDFTRDAWRLCWLPMLLLGGAHTVMFLQQHVAPSEWRPGPLGWIAPLMMIFYVPLYGGLYRAAIGGRPMLSKGFGGLQWSGPEWRLVVVGLVLSLIIGLTLTPFLAITGVLALVLGQHRTLTFGPFGELTYWAVASIPVWLVFILIMAPRIGRLVLGWPFSIAREKTEPFAGWGPGPAFRLAVAIALLLACLPVAAGEAGLYALTLVDPDTFAASYWPLPIALGAGAVTALLKVAVQAPLCAGVLAGAWWLLEGDHLEAGAEGEHIHVDPPAEAHHEAAPHDEAAAAEPPALAAQEAAELGLDPAQVDHAAADHAAEGQTHAAAEGEALENHDPAPEAEAHEMGAHEIDPALAGIHPIEPEAATGAAADEAAAAALAAEAYAVEAHPEVPPEVPEVHEPVEPHHDIPVEAPAAIEPLSPWPHSVLPPWPSGVKATVHVAPVATLPLVSGREPAHPSREGSEPG